MKLHSLLIALVLLAPSVPTADAAVIASTKQKKLPTIADAYVEDDLQGFGFGIVRAPTTNAYDVWARLTNDRGRTVAKWFVGSMKFRRRSETIDGARFSGDLRDILEFTQNGTYELTLFACPANLKRPTETACASTKTSFDYAVQTLD